MHMRATLVSNFTALLPFLKTQMRKNVRAIENVSYNIICESSSKVINEEQFTKTDENEAIVLKL